MGSIRNTVLVAEDGLKAIVFLLLFALCVLRPALGQTQSSILTVERVFADPSLSGPKIISPSLSPDATLLTWLQPKKDQGQVLDLWAVNVSGGMPFMLVDANKFSSIDKRLSDTEIARRERMRIMARGIISYEWDGAARAILVPLDGDIYYVDRKSRVVSRLTDTPDDELDANLSPDGRYISFVRGNRLYCKDIRSKVEQALTPAATDTVSYGVAEFIAQEEFERYTGYWWSPKSDAVAYTRVDESGVDIVNRLEEDGDTVKTVAQRYPRAGRPNAVVELFVTRLMNASSNQAPIKIDLGESSDIYLVRVRWSEDGRKLYVQRLSRDQKRLDLLQADPVSGQTKVILSEVSDTWVALGHDFTPLSDGQFLWTSERDGNKHIYLYAPDGKLIRQVTKGDWPVDAVKSVNEATGQVWFQAGRETPIEQRLYVTSFRKYAEATPVTKAGGWWSTDMAAGGKAFIGYYSDPLTPPQTALYDGNGRRLRWLQENRLDARHPYAPYKDTYSPPEFGTLKADDGQVLHHMMFKPRGFDPAKKYPVIVLAYGGPARALVEKMWMPPSLRLWQEAGYILFVLDNRGTPGRSRDFSHTIYKRFGGPDVDDQIKGGHWLKTLPYVDGDHIGIYGWSQGGFVTLMALTTKDSPFTAGIAGAPPTLWSLYDTAYTERYMSTPEDNPQGYAASDVVKRLNYLKPGSLLLLHGMSDDNVIFAHSARLIEAMQLKGLSFEMMLYLGERHHPKGVERARARVQLQLDFFNRKLKPQAGITAN